MQPGQTSKQVLQPDEYQCAGCHGVFRYGWSQEEMQAEFDRDHPGYKEPTIMVCDDCYNLIMNNKNQQPPEDDA